MSEKESIDFFYWLRNCELKYLKNSYLKIYEKNNKVKKFIEEYLNIDSFSYEETLEKFNNANKKRKEFYDNVYKKNFDFFNLKNKEKENWVEFYEILFYIKNSLEKLDNSKMNKIWKHKFLYFLVSFAIYASIKKNNIWENINDIFKIFEFYNNDNEMKWYAFEKGPILKNIYRNVNLDYQFSIKKLRKEQLEVLEIAFILLKDYSTIDLIEESHETDPWKNSFKKGKYYSLIKNKEIINFFSKNEPFFCKNFFKE